MDRKCYIYVCHTLFNVLVTLLKVMTDTTKEYIVFVPDNIKFIPKIFVGKYINKLVVYPNVEIKDNWNIYKSENKSSFFTLKRSLKKVVELAFNMDDYNDLLKKSSFYVFNDGVPFVSYLMLKYPKNHFTLIEEGELIYSVPNKGLRFWYKALIAYPRSHGYSSVIDSIEVRYPDRLSRNVRCKAHKMEFSKLLTDLTTSQRSELLTFFNVNIDLSLKSDKPTLLLLTQPLSEDNIITEIEKQNLFLDIVSSYIETYNIYVKPHPKENTNYKELIKGCCVISKDSPSELFELLDLEFDKAITLFSTSIHSIPAKERIFLGLDYHPKVKREWMKKMDVKMKM